jgi:hypothetical protein
MPNDVAAADTFVMIVFPFRSRSIRTRGAV